MSTSTEDGEVELPDWALPKTSNKLSEVKASLVNAIKKYVFVICTALVIFASLRNSLTWGFERFWGASKTLWEDAWRYIFMEMCHGDRFITMVAGTSLLSFVHFWFFAAFYIILDIFQPSFVMKYKIQDNTNTPLDRKKFIGAVKVCLFNQLITLPFAVLPLYYLMEKRGSLYTAEELPTFQRVLLEGIVFTLVEEVGFYYTHRISHHPSLYKHYHKRHHEWTSSISIIAIYSHPVEHLVSNVWPVFLGPLLMGSHVATLWVWIMVAQLSTLNSHCGYHLPFMPSPEAHDYHHLKFTNNFGVLGVLDRLHGTDANFMKTKAYDRHIMMIGLQPIKEVYPDEKPKGACHEKVH